MAEQQSPTVEIAPTVIVSSSNEGENNDDNDNGANEIDDNSSNASANENTGVDSERAGSELSSHNSGDATENGSPPDVTIAEIEASRDIALAEIGASVERERIELEAERIETLDETNKEYQECREEIAQLRERVEELTNLLIPPTQSEETLVTEELPTASEMNLTEPSTAAPTVETQMEVSEESVEENQPVVEETVAVRKFIAI